MNIFSYILAGTFLYSFIKYSNNLKKLFRSLFLLASIVSLTLSYGYFIMIGSYEFSYDEICVGILFVVALFYMMEGRYNRKILQWSLLFLLSGIIAVLFMLIFPKIDIGYIPHDQSWDHYVYGRILKTYEFSISAGSFMILFRFFLLFIIIAVIKEIFTIEDWKYIYNIILFVVKAYILYGFIELILKNLFKIDVGNTFLTPFFGLGKSTYSTLSERGGLYMLQGFFRETSTFSTFLFVAAIFFCLEIRANNLKKINYLWLASCLFLTLLSGSFSGILYSALILIFFVFCLKKNRRNILLFFALMFMVLLAVFLSIYGFGYANYYLERLETTFEAINSIISDGAKIKASEYIRLASGYNLMQLWIRYPLFGIGYGTASGHSSFWSMLASGGIVGFLIYYHIVFRLGMGNKKLKLGAVLIFFSWALTGSIGGFYSLSNLILFYVICNHDLIIKYLDKTNKVLEN